MSTNAHNPPARPAILLLGASGLLGRATHEALTPLGSVHAPPSRALDLRDAAAVHQAVGELRPALVVNCAGYTDVDGAEDNAQAADALNHRAVATLAQACDAAGATLVHFSTDFVFDGAAGRPYTEADEARPLGVYGQTKLAGERAVLASPGAHLVLRVSWLHGPGGRNFFSQVGQWLQDDRELAVVADQVSVPNRVEAIAAALAALLGQAAQQEPGWLAERRGLYHFSAAQAMSRFEFAQREAQRLGAAARARLVPVSAQAFAGRARRPMASVLDSNRLQAVFGIEIGL